MIWNGAQRKKAKNAIKLICSRFSWHSEKVFRIVNESNLDCYIEITMDLDADGIEKPNIKLISAVKVDNLFENKKQLDSYHMLKDKKILSSQNDILARLIRKSQEYKVELMHARNLKEHKEMAYKNMCVN